MNRCGYILGRLEHWDNKSAVVLYNLTIEHIIPQNPHLSADWVSVLGSDWDVVIQNSRRRLAINMKFTDAIDPMFATLYAKREGASCPFQNCLRLLCHGLYHFCEWYNYCKVYGYMDESGTPGVATRSNDFLVVSLILFSDQSSIRKCSDSIVVHDLAKSRTASEFTAIVILK
ncbi:MAG: hypothetical protein LBJ12_00410 [Oscillospiraceae bacterium]|jgi:hypothetical protein|nr:hypothetical protein [Oscillospiraceae bacterium]